MLQVIVIQRAKCTSLHFVHFLPLKLNPPSFATPVASSSSNFSAHHERTQTEDYACVAEMARLQVLVSTVASFCSARGPLLQMARLLVTERSEKGPHHTASRYTSN